MAVLYLCHGDFSSIDVSGCSIYLSITPELRPDVQISLERVASLRQQVFLRRRSNYHYRKLPQLNKSPAHVLAVDVRHGIAGGPLFNLPRGTCRCIKRPSVVGDLVVVGVAHIDQENIKVAEKLHQFAAAGLEIAGIAVEQKDRGLSVISCCLQLAPDPGQLLLAYDEGFWVRHIERVHRHKTNGANRKRIVGVLGHCLQKIGETLLLDIVIADDGAPRAGEPIQFSTHHRVCSAASVVSHISRQEDKAHGSSKCQIYLVDDLRQIKMVLLPGTGHMQIAEMNPADD